MRTSRRIVALEVRVPNCSGAHGQELSALSWIIARFGLFERHQDLAPNPQGIVHAFESCHRRAARRQLQSPGPPYVAIIEARDAYFPRNS
jgi:hypothetical protein